MPDLFSISAMFILFRETLEACVIISVMLQLCMKLKLTQLRKWGRHLSIILSIIGWQKCLVRRLDSAGRY